MTRLSPKAHRWKEGAWHRPSTGSRGSAGRAVRNSADPENAEAGYFGERGLTPETLPWSNPVGMEGSCVLYCACAARAGGLGRESMGAEGRATGTWTQVPTHILTVAHTQF